MRPSLAPDSAPTVGILRVRLAIPAATLKEKRAVVKSLAERLRNRFNASIAEIAELDDPGRATIAAAVISNSGAHADAQMAAIAAAIEATRLDAEVLDIATELIAL